MNTKVTYQNRVAEPAVSFWDYIQLTKPTITLLVVVTVIPSLFIAAPTLPSTMTAIASILGAMLASASAAVFNQVIEFNLDVSMKRTQNRSLVKGSVEKGPAIIFGTILGCLSIGILITWTNLFALYAAIAGHIFYVVIYTLILKPRTVQNIVIGGAAGAVGPLIGWAAVTGSYGWPAWVLFLIICIWTPPHFWALALKYKEDYANAGVPMYPVVHGDHKTRQMMFVYTLFLLPAVVSLFFYPPVGYFYLVSSLLFTIKFIKDAWKIYRSGNNDQVMPFFHYSCFYTFGVFGSLMLTDSLA